MKTLVMTPEEQNKRALKLSQFRHDGPASPSEPDYDFDWPEPLPGVRMMQDKPKAFLNRDDLHMIAGLKCGYPMCERCYGKTT